MLDTGSMLAEQMLDVEFGAEQLVFIRGAWCTQFACSLQGLLGWCSLLQTGMCLGLFDVKNERLLDGRMVDGFLTDCDQFTELLLFQQ